MIHLYPINININTILVAFYLVFILDLVCHGSENGNK